VPFLRFTRDKRGVENYYLVHSTTNRRGKVRPRVLYWYRSPPDVKVGREPFDPELRRALEKQHPDITFDWRAIVETPIPSADADKWRERRRAERAAKHAAAAEESAEAAGVEADAAAADTAADSAPDAAPDADNDSPSDSPAAIAGVEAAPPNAAPSAPAVNNRSGDPNRKRRRRRRSGGGGRGAAPASNAPARPGASTPEPSGD